MRARRAAFREPAAPGAPARGRRRRAVDLDPHSRRGGEDRGRGAGDVAVPDRARYGARRPRALLAAGQGARGNLEHQRHVLGARRSRRVRPLARSRERWLGLRRRTALFHAHGGLLGRRPGRARQVRPPGDQRLHTARSPDRCVSARLCRGRNAGESGLQRRPLRRRRNHPVLDSARAALERSRGVPAAGDEARRTARGHRREGHARAAGR